MSWNIVDIVNQLFFAYFCIVAKLKVFVLSLIKAIKTTNFIHTLKEKQEI